MKRDTDLTLFWLAWRKTCSIRLCCAGREHEYKEKCGGDPDLCGSMETIQGFASSVIDSMNDRFHLLLRKESEVRGARLSSLDSEARARGSDLGSAFELLESHLYAKQFLKGKPFKDYLFEDAAGRPGGMNRNLFGYLQRVMATVVHESYGENVYRPSQDENGKDIEPAKISLSGHTETRPTDTPYEYAEMHEVEEVFRQYLSSHGKDWDADHWLVLFCILNVLRVGSENIQPLFSKGHQTNNVLCGKMRSELLVLLREGFSDKAIGMALNGSLQAILDEKVLKMRWYGDITKILEENRKSTGK